MEKPGFNVRQLESGDFIIGIHLETFKNSSQNFIAESGWVNFKITKNETPRGDYTHRGKFLSPKKSFTEKLSDELEKKDETW